MAVQLRKNIVVSGSTGTGKTTTSNALILEVPAGERLITIEDAPELVTQFVEALGGHRIWAREAAAQVIPA